MESDKTRAFICIDFPSEVVKEIARVQELIGKKKFTGKLTELENLHLTLKFLGEVNEEKLNEIKKRLSKVKMGEFEAKLGEVGIFSYHNKPRIVWIKNLGKGIHELQKKVDEVLEGLFEKEERFMSHLTVARVKYVKDKKDFVNYIEKLNVKELNWKVREFKLMKSELRPVGPVYGMIERFGLTK